MENEFCSACKFAQLVWLPTAETHGGVHSSDTRIDMYICHNHRAQHYGHIMLGDHGCLGFKERDVAK
jgi:hypothetical protein